MPCGGSFSENVVQPDKNAKILRGIHMPEHLDARFKLYAEAFPSSKKDTLLRRLIVRSLRVALPSVDEAASRRQGDEPMVFRTVFLPKELDNELKKVAFKRGQSKGQLMCGMIRGALDRARMKPALAD